MRNNRRRRAQRGLMLIEILVVITIIGMVTGIIGVGIAGALRDSEIETARLQISKLTEVMDLYRMKFHRYPTTAEGFELLVNPPKGEQLLKAIPEDPWGERYVLQSPGRVNKRGFDIYSKGPDNQADTEDDVR